MTPPTRKLIDALRSVGILLATREDVDRGPETIKEIRGIILKLLRDLHIVHASATVYPTTQRNGSGPQNVRARDTTKLGTRLELLNPDQLISVDWVIESSIDEFYEVVDARNKGYRTRANCGEAERALYNLDLEHKRAVQAHDAFADSLKVFITDLPAEALGRAHSRLEQLAAARDALADRIKDAQLSLQQLRREAGYLPTDKLT